MKKYLIFILLVGLLDSKYDPTYQLDLNDEKLLEKATSAYNFCIKNNMNTDYCILIDMSIHSGKNRLFVWDFKQKTIIKQSLVSHGCGNYIWGMDFTKTDVKLSNTPESHCSSDGKYKIGRRGYSNWGIHVNYKLYGLDKTNDNALKRLIVLHAWKAISDEEIYPRGTPEGWGCPAVSNNMMTYLDNKLKSEKKPVLLWIYKGD